MAAAGAAPRARVCRVPRDALKRPLTVTRGVCMYVCVVTSVSVSVVCARRGLGVGVSVVSVRVCVVCVPFEVTGEWCLVTLS